MVSLLVYVLFALAFIVFLSILKIKYNSIVILDIFLLSIVLFEPSPSDIIFCALIVFGFINQVYEFGRIRNQAFFILLLFIYQLINIAGIIGAEDAFLSMKYSAITFYLILFSIFIFLYNTYERYIYLIRAYVVSTTFSSILAVLGYMGFFTEILLTYGYRVKGLFKDPNVFGPFIIPTLLILLDDLKRKRVIKSNSFIYFIVIALNLTAIVLSFSRACWINLLVAILTYCALNYRAIKLKRIISVGLIVLLLGGAFWVLAPDNALKSSFTERTKIQNYDQNRFSSQRAGIELASLNPLGYGPGQFENVVVRLTNENLAAHNLYIRVLMENGAAGFIIFICFIFYIIFNLFKSHYFIGKSIELSNSVLLSILIGILVNSLVVDTLHWRHLWFFLGLSLFNIYTCANKESITSIKPVYRGVSKDEFR